jgi:MerR family transcriptional regulator/heat shock protein HspR
MREAPDARRVGLTLRVPPRDPGLSSPIGVVADLLGVSEQTLRLYEVHGLVKPARRNRERSYCAGDVRWLGCLRRLIHTEKVSIEGVKRLLTFAPCWKIIGPEARGHCPQCPVHVAGSGGPVVNGGSGWGMVRAEGPHGQEGPRPTDERLRA